MNKQTHEMIARLGYLGVSYPDAITLRRIAMTLHRWFELECGDSNNYASWAITRGRKDVETGDFHHDEDGKPFIERHLHSENEARYEAIPDRENGAKKRLAKIMKQYPQLQAYIQTDPRGAPLYILPPGVDAENYNNGIAVYR
jgi:hypothetical protein